MALSIFDDKAVQPRSAALGRALGRSHAAWQKLTAWTAERYDPLVEEWVWGGAPWGWSLRLKHKKRAVLYLTPSERFFRVGLVLGDKAVRTASGMDLPAALVRQIKTAKKYAEGRAVRLDVRYKKDLAPVQRLVEAKMAH